MCSYLVGSYIKLLQDVKLSSGFAKRFAIGRILSVHEKGCDLSFAGGLTAFHVPWSYFMIFEASCMSACMNRGCVHCYCEHNEKIERCDLDEEAVTNQDHLCCCYSALSSISEVCL